MLNKFQVSIILASILLNNCSNNMKIEKLPNYIVYKHDDRRILNSKSAKELKFPLSKADKRDISILEKKFDQEKNCAGLAAPQIGINKRFMVFAVPNDPLLRKHIPELTQFMPKSIWINPSYEPTSSKMQTRYEACFSVYEATGEVTRYNDINYKAYDLEGTLITGFATGFLARVIQHEIDHLNGIEFTKYVKPGTLITGEDFKKKLASYKIESEKMKYNNKK